MTKNEPPSAHTHIKLKKIIQTSQAIEGYKAASAKVIQKIQQLRRQYGIQVSPRK